MIVIKVKKVKKSSRMDGRDETLKKRFRFFL